MIQYKLRKNANTGNAVSYGKWYAVALINETVGLDALAEHMSKHNTPYSKGTIKGILTDMVSCIREQIADGKAVKIDDLAIFKVGIGICYEGGLRADGTPADTRTPEQKEKLIILLRLLKGFFPEAEVRGHRDITRRRQSLSLLRCEGRIQRYWVTVFEKKEAT